LSEEYTRGLRAAAQLLRDTAADYTQMASQVQEQLNQESRESRSFPNSIRDRQRRDLWLYQEKASLLRGQAAMVMELTP
jgi:hypothetical protein